jgi:hypothetical protein
MPVELPTAASVGAIALGALGRFGEAFGRVREAMRIAEEAGHVYSLLFPLFGLGIVKLDQGDFAGAVAPPVISARKLEMLRHSLIQHAGHLHAILSPAWRRYLALPREILDPAAQPNLEALTELEQHFAKIENSPNYKHLAKHPEFQTTYELLSEYVAALSASHSTLQLPPPPER